MSVLWGLAATLPSSAGADATDLDVARERLVGWSQTELKLIEPHLAMGPVGLVEFIDSKAADALPGVHVATYVNAPADVVAALLVDPAGYPKFMRTLDDVKVLAKRDNTLVYAWRWQVGLFALRGRNVMTTYAPPAGRARQGYRIGVESTEGDLGRGRMLFKVVPAGNERTLLTVSMRMDLRDANYITRQLSRASRSTNRSANMALCYTMVLSVKARAEEGRPAPPKRTHALSRPTLSPEAYAKVLSRGDLVLLRARDTELEQVTVLGRIGHPPEKVREVMLDANAFGRSLLPGSRAKVIHDAPGRVDFEWGIGLPLVGVSGTMRLETQADEIAIEAVSGAFEGGQWRFVTPPYGDATLVIGWAHFDLHKSNFLMERLVDADPYLGHGLSASSQIMLLRAIRSRVHKAQ